MNVLRCQVKLSKVVQVDIPEEKLGKQLPEVLAKLTARQEYGYDYDVEVLLIERSHVETAPNSACTGRACPNCHDTETIVRYGIEQCASCGYPARQ